MNLSIKIVKNGVKVESLTLFFCNYIILREKYFFTKEKNMKLTMMLMITIFSLFGINSSTLEKTNEPIIYDERAEVDVPILMYHHITEEAAIIENSMTITPERFEEHVKTMIEMGYTPIFLEELIAYVEQGIALPQKPICITFDDGYTSNYEYAFPILKNYNARANIAIIGTSIGASSYKDTDNEIIPHFDMDAAREMENSGLISIISHTYDMHQAEAFESGDKIRVNALKLENETDLEYENALKDDFKKITKILKEELGKNNLILAYPYGKYTEESNAVLKELGVKMTLTTSSGTNKIKKGNLECLYNLRRYTIYENS